MNMKRWTTLLPGLSVGAALLGFAVPQASAQTHDQRAEKNAFQQHQRQERALYGKRAVKGHQKQEKRTFKMEERAERRGRRGWYNNGPGYRAYPQPYRRGQYHGGVYSQGQYGGYSQRPHPRRYPPNSQYLPYAPYPGNGGDRHP